MLHNALLATCMPLHAGNSIQHTELEYARSPKFRQISLSNLIRFKVLIYIYLKKENLLEYFVFHMNSWKKFYSTHNMNYFDVTVFFHGSWSTDVCFSHTLSNSSPCRYLIHGYTMDIPWFFVIIIHHRFIGHHIPLESTGNVGYWNPELPTRRCLLKKNRSSSAWNNKIVWRFDGNNIFQHFMPI